MPTSAPEVLTRREARAVQARAVRPRPTRTSVGRRLRGGGLMLLVGGVVVLLAVAALTAVAQKGSLTVSAEGPQSARPWWSGSVPVVGGATSTSVPAAGATGSTATSATTSGAGTPSRTKRAATSVGIGSLNSARSGLSWPSGVYVANQTPSEVAAFEAWRGRKVDVVVVWSNRSSWSDVTNPSYLLGQWKGSAVTKVWGVPMVPEGVGGVSLSACANGDYNAHWRDLATNFKNAGVDSTSIIRLGWEFNGDWYLWKATDPAAFTGCWRQVVSTVRAIAPAIRWDWTVNRGVTGGQPDPTLAWPGDDYVDIVGVDSYDQWPAATSASTFTSGQVNGKQGLAYWLKYAKAHGKKMSVPEWGSFLSGDNPGGDNPTYVKSMIDYFRAHASDIAYESNFQDVSSGTGGIYFENTQVPGAAAAYRSALG